MAIEATKLKEIIVSAFPDSEVILNDLAGDGDHYEVIIRSPVFAGKSRIEQHRMVNNALKDCLGGTLHALAIKTQILE